MPLKLTHLNLPARDPEGLAQWYERQFGYERRGTFLVGPETLLAFEPGEPLAASGRAHFGFAVETEDEVITWARHFGTPIESELGYSATKIRDPEGNYFEIYWEPEGPRPDTA